MAAAAPQIAPMPPGLELADGYVIRFAALDPTTGATVAGVNVSDATLQLNNLAGSAAADLVSGPFMLVPGTGA